MRTIPSITALAAWTAFCIGFLVGDHGGEEPSLFGDVASSLALWAAGAVPIGLAFVVGRLLRRGGESRLAGQAGSHRDRDPQPPIFLG